MAALKRYPGELREGAVKMLEIREQDGKGTGRSASLCEFVRMCCGGRRWRAD
jgi:hypothetical protein